MAEMAVTSSGLTKLLYVQQPPPHPPAVNFSHNLLKSASAEDRWKGLKVMSVKARFGSSKGGAGVLERPSFDQSQFDPYTQVLEGGDIGRVKDKKGTGSGDGYRVLLLDDARHSENLVAKVLPQVVPSVTPDDARRLFHVSRENGLAVVIITVKEHAEFYSQMMMDGGLRSSIEPVSAP